MTVDTLLMLSGTLVAILPFLGFPQSWDKVLFLILGILVVALGIVVRRRGNRPPAQAGDGQTFSKASPAQTDVFVSRHDEMAQ